jgi:hypothetical protein
MEYDEEYGESRWNDTNRGKYKNPEKILSITDSAWIDRGANPGLRGERMMTDRL